MDTTEEEWNKIIDTNLKGAFLFTKAVLPNMIENKFGDVIVNVSSGAGKYVLQTYLHIVQANLV